MTIVYLAFGFIALAIADALVRRLICAVRGHRWTRAYDREFCLTCSKWRRG